MFELLAAPYDAVASLIKSGGQPVAWIFVAGIVLWTFIFERLWFFYRTLPELTARALAQWEARTERTSWAAHQIRKALISRLNIAMSANLPMMKALVPLCPLLGLVGTVSGLVEVFDSTAILGSADGRVIASGVSQAMDCILTGLAVSISGLYPVFQFQSLIRLQTEHLSHRFKF